MSKNEKRCFDNWYSQNGGKIEREKVLFVECTNGEFIVKTNKNQINTKTVIAANGAKRKKLNVIGENDFIGRGISWYAQCDGTFFKGKKVAVIGGGNTAAHLHRASMLQVIAALQGTVSL